jgi:DNA (cytosine-5)-methyltransferase 1
MRLDALTIKFVDLFAGIGGFSLGLERAGMECVGHVELEPFCQKILKKHWPDVPLVGDIRDVTKESFEAVDLICGGPPCQPISHAGKRRGEEDDRWLWGEALAVVAMYEPRWVLFENPLGILTMGIDGILAELEGLGYEVGLVDIPACAVNAPHLRHRVWILGHTRHASGRKDDSSGYCHKEGQRIQPDGTKTHDFSGNASQGNLGHTEGILGGQFDRERSAHQGNLADASQQRINGSGDAGKRRRAESTDNDKLGHSDRQGLEERQVPENRTRNIWKNRETITSPGWSDYQWIRGWDGKNRRVKPGIRLLADGVPQRVARLKALGNAVVPAIAEEIGRVILEA